MVTSKQKKFQKKITHLALLILLTFFSFTASAIVIEGTIKGVITDVISEGTKPQTAFFDLAQKGQAFSADFWYEFDENNFPPTSSSDISRKYDFGFSDMGMAFHIGTETLSLPASSNLELFSYRNLISIFRSPDREVFTLSTDTKYMGDYFSDDIWSANIAFFDEVMRYFTDFDLIQNLSLTAQDNSILGSFDLFNYGVDIGVTNGHVDHRHYYDIFVTGDFSDLTIGVRNSTVSESSSIGLMYLMLMGAIALLIRRRSPPEKQNADMMSAFLFHLFSNQRSVASTL